MSNSECKYVRDVKLNINFNTIDFPTFLLKNYYPIFVYFFCWEMLIFYGVRNLLVIHCLGQLSTLYRQLTYFFFKTIFFYWVRVTFEKTLLNMPKLLSNYIN